MHIVKIKIGTDLQHHPLFCYTLHAKCNTFKYPSKILFTFCLFSTFYEALSRSCCKYDRQDLIFTKNGLTMLFKRIIYT
jgi:hypothetical protein